MRMRRRVNGNCSPSTGFSSANAASAAMTMIASSVPAGPVVLSVASDSHQNASAPKPICSENRLPATTGSKKQSAGSRQSSSARPLESVTNSAKPLFGLGWPAWNGVATLPGIVHCAWAACPPARASDTAAARVENFMRFMVLYPLDPVVPFAVCRLRALMG